MRQLYLNSMTGCFADGFKIRNYKGHEVRTHLDSGIKMVLNKPGSYVHRLHLKTKHSTAPVRTLAPTIFVFLLSLEKIF